MKASPITHGTLAIALLLLPFSSLISQDCPNGVQLIADTLLCETGTLPTQELLANYTDDGTVLSFAWAPAAQFTDPGSAQTTFNATASTEVILTVESLGDELIQNGDFSLGDTGFTSDYTWGNSMSSIGPLADEGQYRISNNPQATHSQYAPCTDHTSQSGNMMVVNGLGEPSNVWCQVVTIDADTDYAFSAWVTSVVSQNPAQLQFSINGQLIGQPFEATGSLCNWQDFQAGWNSGTATSAEICIENVNLSPAGNDFAIDDISFRALCTSSDTVMVNIVDSGTAAFTVPAEICQLDETYVLDDLLDPGAVPGGTWQLDGQPVTEFNSSQLTTGSHELVYEINPGVCLVGETRTFIIQPPQEAGAFAMMPDAICLGTALQSDALPTNLSGNDPGGEWIGPAGFPAGLLNPNSGVLSLEGAPAGTYEFAYLLPDVGVCPADSAVTSLTLHPEISVEAEEEYIIDCFEPRTTILPSLRPIANYDVAWYNIGSPTTPVATGLSFTTGTAGGYRVVATDPNTGCAAEGFLTVTSNIADIALTISADSLDCDVETRDGVLRIESVTGGEGPYVYSFNGGGFVRDTVYDNLVPNRGYTLVAQDINGCADTVTYNFFDPADWTLDLATDGNPVVNFGESVKLVVNTTLPTEEIESLTWDPVPPNCESCLETVVRPDSITNYLVTIENRYGCVQADSLSVLIFIGKLVYTPTAFSPNGDGLNDTFTLLGGEGVVDIELLEIFSRWGELLYQGTGLDPRDINTGWDGKIRGEPAPPGAYLYRAQVRLFDERLFEFEGVINLVR